MAGGRTVARIARETNSPGGEARAEGEEDEEEEEAADGVVAAVRCARGRGRRGEISAVSEAEAAEAEVGDAGTRPEPAAAGRRGPSREVEAPCVACVGHVVRRSP